MGTCGSHTATKHSTTVVRVERFQSNSPSPVTESSTALKKQNEKVELELQIAKKNEKRTIKMLLLGTGECGKSTILKQLRLAWLLLAYSDGFNSQDLQIIKSAVHKNIIESALSIAEGVHKLHLNFELDKSQEHLECIRRASGRCYTGHVNCLLIDVHVVDAIKFLWTQEPAIQRVYEMRNRIQLSDSTKYFFDNIDRLSHPDYQPSIDDVIRVRVRTTGIYEHVIRVKQMNFRIIDVGGQRSERRKWLHCFDSVNCLIYITAVNEFDQMLLEDEHQNRLVESLMLYKSIMTSPWFQKQSVVLFLNKTDLFHEKLMKGRSIKSLFEDYQGPNTYASSILFIREKFASQVSGHCNKRVYMHETCATDYNQIQFVLESVIDSMIAQFMGLNGS